MEDFVKQFELCLKAAEQIVALSKAINAPDEFFSKDPPRSGGSYGTPHPEKTSQVLQAYAQYLPGVINATNNMATPTAQATLAAEQATSPGEAALNTALTGQYAPQLAAINSAIQSQQAQAGSKAVAQELGGSGGTAARAAVTLNKELNPNYYTAQDAATRGAAAGVNAINLNGLSPGESNAVERSTNQTQTATGNLGLVNPTNTISNAINFGGAFNNKIGLLNNATNTATNVANSAASGGGVNPVSVALQQPGTTGATQFAPSTTGQTGASSALQFGQGLLGTQAGMNTAAIGAAASRANANSVPSYLGAMPSYS